MRRRTNCSLLLIFFLCRRTDHIKIYCPENLSGINEQTKICLCQASLVGTQRIQIWDSDRSKPFLLLCSLSSSLEVLFPTGPLLILNFLGFDLLGLLFENSLDKDSFVLELVAFGGQIKFVIDGSIDLFGLPVLPQQPPQHSLPPDPQDLGGHPAFAGTSPLAHASVPAQPLGLEMLSSPCPRMYSRLTFHNETVFNELSDEYSRVCLAYLLNLARIHPYPLLPTLQNFGCQSFLALQTDHRFNLYLIQYKTLTFHTKYQYQSTHMNFTTAKINLKPCKLSIVPQCNTYTVSVTLFVPLTIIYIQQQYLHSLYPIRIRFPNNCFSAFQIVIYGLCCVRLNIITMIIVQQSKLKMSKRKPNRINFRINHCSSEDPEYPVSQLLSQSPNAKGWQSERFAKYPQTIIYELVEPTIVKQISILSHQSKIATKVIIHNRLQANKQWHKLGFLSLESNVNSNYQARELKTVNLHDKPTLQLRFSFQANYVNAHNVFSQVGVISLCVFGEQMMGEDISRPLGSTKLGNMDLDKNTIMKLKELEVQKKMAIDRQDYDQAQNVKMEIQRIKSLGATLMALEEKKKKAVENEDYEGAKVINNKIKQIRESSGGGPNFSARPSGTPSDYYNKRKVNKQVEEQVEPQPSISPTTMIQKQTKKPIDRNVPKKVQDQDRPIIVKNTNPYENITQGQFHPESDESTRVEPLPKQLRAQCTQYFQIFDEQIFAHLFSQHHANRQQGLNLAKQELMAGGHNQHDMASAFLYVVKSMISDKNIMVLMRVIDFFAVGLKKVRPPPGNPFSQQCEEIIEKLNDYLGHSNEKVKRATEQLYYSLPAYPVTNKDLCYKVLTQIGKREKPPKILTGRLRALDAIVESFQLGKNYQNVIGYAVKYADDKNNEVRNAAITVICRIANQIGYPAIQPFLKTLRPQIAKTIQQKCIQQGQPDHRSFDQQPIPTKNPKKSETKHPRQQFVTDNQFMNEPAEEMQDSNQICDYCKRFDKNFVNGEYLDLHWFHACPMLTLCSECSQTVEVCTLTAHRVGQCTNSKYFKKCPRCKQAVHQRNYKVHAEKKQCIPAKPPAVASRCPLCHLDIDPGKQGWKTHLVEEGCENNPRK